MLGMFLRQSGECCLFFVLFPCENTPNVAGHQKAAWIPKDPQGTKISWFLRHPPALQSLCILELARNRARGTPPFPNSV